MVKCEDQKSFAFLKKEEKEKESELRMPLTAQGIYIEMMSTEQIR